MPGPVWALADFAVDGEAAEIDFSVDGSLRRRAVGTYLVQTGARLLVQR